MPRQLLQERQVPLVQAEGGLQRVLHLGGGAHMIEVCVRSQDVRDARARTLHGLEDALGLVPRVHDHPRPALAVLHDSAVLLERADDVWETHDGWMHTRERLPEPPSTYYHDHVFGCFFRDNHGLKSIYEIGVNNVTYETDYPHTDTTWPHTVDYVEKIMAGFPDEIVHKILRGNALRMLSLDENLRLVN